MIKLLIGKPGTGKTKKMIEDANTEIVNAKGSIIFVAESDETVLEVNHDIRFINISEFPITSSNSFVAFLNGIMVSNYDIEKIYLDGISNVFIMTDEEKCDWLEKIEEVSEKFKVDFEISISVPDEVPECFNKYM